MTAEAQRGGACGGGGGGCFCEAFMVSLIVSSSSMSYGMRGSLSTLSSSLAFSARYAK
jgi:hypothetical protein